MPFTTSSGACASAKSSLGELVATATVELLVDAAGGCVMGLCESREAAATTTTKPTAAAVQTIWRRGDCAPLPDVLDFAWLPASATSRAAEVRAHRSRGASGIERA